MSIVHELPIWRLLLASWRKTAQLTSSTNLITSGQDGQAFPWTLKLQTCTGHVFETRGLPRRGPECPNWSRNNSSKREWSTFADHFQNLAHQNRYAQWIIFVGWAWAKLDTNSREKVYRRAYLLLGGIAEWKSLFCRLIRRTWGRMTL